MCNVSVCDFCRGGSGLETTGVSWLCPTQSKSPRPDRLSSTWRMSLTQRCRLSTERWGNQLMITMIRLYFLCFCAVPWRVQACHGPLTPEDFHILCGSEFTAMTEMICFNSSISGDIFTLISLTFVDVCTIFYAKVYLIIKQLFTFIQ